MSDAELENLWTVLEAAEACGGQVVLTTDELRRLLLEVAVAHVPLRAATEAGRR